MKKVSVFVRIRCPLSAGTTVRFPQDLVSEITGICNEIEENDFNLNIPRYVDTFEEENEVDIAAVQKEIKSRENELTEVQNQMDKYLKELMD